MIGRDALTDSAGRLSAVRILFLICGAVILFAAVLNLLNIFLRVFTVVSFDLVLDAAVWCTVWAALIGGAPLALLSDGHIAIRMLPSKLGKRGKRLVLAAAILAGFSVSLIMAYAGLSMTISLYERDVDFVRYWNVPQWLVKSCIFVSMGLMSVFYAVALKRAIFPERIDASGSVGAQE